MWISKHVPHKHLLLGPAKLSGLVGKPVAVAMGRVLASVARLTKPVVTLSVGGYVIWRHDPAVFMLAIGASVRASCFPWCLTLWTTGAVLNAFYSKFLKAVFRQERPSTATQQDGGMPSSHSMSLLFLATCVSARMAHACPMLCVPVCACVAVSVNVCSSFCLFSPGATVAGSLP